MASISILDSHTAGEPTRLVLAGGPNLGMGTLAEQLEVLRREHDGFRSVVVNEPRGSDVIVGALLCQPRDPACAAGVIFFNNVGYLGMCGHGTIGLVASLAYLGRIQPGQHRVETPVGEVQTTLHASGEVTVANVASYRHRAGVEVEIPGYGRVRGDVAWGGNWFFLVNTHTHAAATGRRPERQRAPVAADRSAHSERPTGATQTKSGEPQFELTVANVEALTAYTWAIRQALKQAGITGSDGAEIDHIELYGPSPGGADSKNFVLCPGRAYDRSPCGTGTSAKLACLYADGKLQPGQLWRQAGILDTEFQGSIEIRHGVLYPSITGRAWVTASAELLCEPGDPFRDGIRA